MVTKIRLLCAVRGWNLLGITNNNPYNNSHFKKQDQKVTTSSEIVYFRVGDALLYKQHNFRNIEVPYQSTVHKSVESDYQVMSSMFGYWKLDGRDCHATTTRAQDIAININYKKQ